MILGNIHDLNQEKLLCDNDKLKVAIDYLKKGNFDNAKNGQIVLADGVKVAYNVLNTNPLNKDRFEAHKEWIDIHYCANGSEDLYIAPTNKLNILEPYSQEKDVLFGSSDNYVKYVLKQGDYLIVFPEEAHAPGCGDGSKLDKMVFKIKC